MTESPLVEQLLENLPIDSIQISSTNPRRHFEQAGLTELAASIAEVGIQVPLLVRVRYTSGDKRKPYYELVAGERRLRAAKNLGMKELPCLVREMSDEEAQVAQIVENLQRADVHPLEEADAYRRLAELAQGWTKPGEVARVGRDLTPGDISKRVGKTAAYVAQRLKLLDLIEVLRQMFLEGYISLGHALIAARLTAEEQDRAAREMLGGAGDYAKMSTAEVFAARKKNIQENEWAKHSRLVKMTEGELKEWVSENVLLQLKTAAWGLEDAKLVATAGACTSCPKRSGSNAALFSDLTAEEDVCLDPACFGTKHKAFIQLTTKKAEEAGEPLLKLSPKSSHKRLPEEVTDKIVFRQGQWMIAKKGSCPAVRKGLLVDGSGMWSGDKYAAGDIVLVCVDQKCKVHKHTVDSPISVAGKAAESWETTQAREKSELDALLAKELPIRRAVYDAVLAKVTPAALYLQSLILSHGLNDASEICIAMGLEYKQSKEGRVGDWRHNDVAAPVLKEFLKKASLEQLHRVAFHSLMIEELTPAGYSLKGNLKRSREKLWEAAVFLGVDADAIAKASAPKPVKAEAEKPAAKNTVAKKAAAKKVPAKKVPAKKAAVRKLTPAARKQIAANMKKRWTAARAVGKKVAAK